MRSANLRLSVAALEKNPRAGAGLVEGSRLCCRWGKKNRSDSNAGDRTNSGHKGAKTKNRELRTENCFYGLSDTQSRVFSVALLSQSGFLAGGKSACFRQVQQSQWTRPQLHARSHRKGSGRPEIRIRR